MNSPFDGSPLPVIRALGWSTVREIIDLESARIVYKSLNGDAPSYMSDMFTKVNVSTTRSLRNSDYDLRVPFLKTTTGQRCFSYRGAKLWNGLSKKTKNTPTLKNFMKAQPRPQGLLSYWDGDEKALASAGHMTIKTPSLSGCHKL